MAPLPVDGIGWDIRCRDSINLFLSAMSEYDKWGSAAASTVTALVPLLISVWGLPTANVLELYLSGEHIAAFLTAGFTFGLPVRQESNFKQYTEANIQSHVANIQSHVANIPALDQSCSGCRHNFYRVVFVAFQVLIVLSNVCFDHFIADAPTQPFWSCPSGMAIWHISFLGAIPVVGFSWWFALRNMYGKSLGQGARSGVLFYCRKFKIHPALRLLPGLLQALLTISYTFMFAVLYGTSIRSALERVIFVAFALFLSRTLSLWHAHALAAWRPKLLIHCEDGSKLEDKHDLIPPPPPPPPSPQPALTVATSPRQCLEHVQPQVQIPGHGSGDHGPR